MTRSKKGQSTRRGQSVRFEKKPKRTFFKMQMPYDRDKIIEDEHSVRSSERNFQHENKLMKKSNFKHKWDEEAEILEKEKQKIIPVAKKTKKK